MVDYETSTVIVVVVLVGVLVFVCLGYFCWRKSLRARGYSTIQGEADVETYLSNAPLKENDRKKKKVQEKNDNASEMEVLSRMYLRSSFTYTLSKALPNVGRRQEKLYMIVNHAHEGERLMAITKKGEKCLLPAKSESTRVIFCQLMVNIRHSFVYPTLDFDYVSDKGLAVSFREWQTKGSLRDIIRSVSPLKPYKTKYALPATSPLGEQRIAIWGRQILEALAFFRSIDFPIRHLHAGNVIIESGVCRISDYENSILELESLFPEDTRKDMNIDDDVIGFGRCLYEMVAGYELETVVPEYYPPTVNAFMRELLDSIFAPADGQGVSIDDILALNFFSSVDLRMNVVNQTPKFDDKTVEFLSKINAGKKIKDHNTKKREKKKDKPSKKIGPPPSTTPAPTLALPASSSSPITATAAAPPPPTTATTTNTATQSTANSSSKPATSAPPPPPPPSAAASRPPPPPSSSSSSTAALPSVSAERSSLLASIQKGKSLKKTVTVDKSKPKFS